MVNSKPLNRAQRRQLARQAKATGQVNTGVSVRVTGYRIVRPDGTIKVQVGRMPEDVKHDS